MLYIKQSYIIIYNIKVKTLHPRNGLCPSAWLPWILTPVLTQSSKLIYLQGIDCCFTVSVTTDLSYLR